MAIIFLQQKKFQKILLGVFVFIVIIALIIIWQNVSKKEKPGLLIEETTIIPKKEIKIDFDKLISQDMQNLVPFPGIEPFKEVAASTTETGEEIPAIKIGRGNPFMPY